MGWALHNLSAEAREQIAETLFEVKTRDGDWLNGLCPFHQDGNPSFGYNVAEDVFTCFAACTEPGDLVDLWALKNGYATKSREGFKAFQAAFAGERGAQKHKTPGKIAKEQKAKQNSEKTAPKPVPESIYQAMGPIPDDMAAELRIRRGWSRDTIDELGLRLLTHYRKSSSPYKIFPIPQRDRIVMPIRDDQGTLWNLRLYYPFGIPDDAPRNKDGEPPAKILSWAKGHGNARLFPCPSLLRPGAVVVVEGESDCICARSYGINAITQTSKTTHWPEDHLKALAGREIYIAYDADQPGQEYARKAAKSMHNAGLNVHIVEWPDFMGKRTDGTWPEDHGQDLTDFFSKHHKDIHQFQVLLNKAPLFDPQAAPSEVEISAKPYMRFFRYSVNGRLSFSERALADYLIENYPMLYHNKSGILYKWDGTYYKVWDDGDLRKTAHNLLDVEDKASYVENVWKVLRDITGCPDGRDLNDKEDWICLKNGMLNIYTLEFQPHNTNFLSTIKLDITWHGDKTPKPDRWLAFLDQTVKTPESIMQLQEFGGYCFTRKTNLGKALLLFGPGADGKSTFLKVLSEIIGKENCSSVSMSDLNDQFKRYVIYGKLLNTMSEVSTEAMQSDMFKAIVTGDPILAAAKYQTPFSFSPFCKLAYATNKIPRVFDNSDGYFRRILPVVFKKQFLEGDPETDINLIDKLRIEYDGIFAWFLIGLHRLMKQGKFTDCDETRDFIMKYRRYNNPVMAFLQDRCALDDASAETEIKQLYKEYKEYCSECGFRPANRENFFEELLNASRKIREDAAVRRHKPRRNGERPDLVVGVRLTHTTEQF